MKRVLAGLLLLVPFAALADDGHTIVQQGRRFHPDEVTIDKGTSLTFQNQDEFIHQIYAPGLFDTDERQPGESITEPFPQTGTFEVHCHIHPKMKLIVHVK